MNIGNLRIEQFNPDILEHYDFMKKSMRDSLFIKYISHIEENAWYVKEHSESFLLDSAYVVYDNDELIGYIKVQSTYINSLVKLQYYIDSSKRKEGYGFKLLTESTEFLFNEFKELKEIELDIDKYNYPSINLALKANYKKVDREIFKRKDRFVLY